MFRKRLLRRAAVCLIALGALVPGYGHGFAAEGAGGPETIKPLFDRVVLRVDGKELKPIRVQSPARIEHSLDGRRFIVENDRVTEIEPLGAKPLWHADSPDGAHLRWLNAYGDVAYLIGTNAGRMAAGGHIGGPYLLAITRLDIDDAGRSLQIALGTEQSATTLAFAFNGPAE